MTGDLDDECEVEPLPDHWYEGMRVLLVPDHSQGLELERGVLRSGRQSNGTVVVEVDRRHRNGDLDDGLREVDVEWVDPRCPYWQREDDHDGCPPCGRCPVCRSTNRT